MTDNEVKWLIVGKLLRRNLMAAKGEQWEVLYEGTVTTDADGWWPYDDANALAIPVLPRCGLIRLSYNGKALEQAITYTEFGAPAYIGNGNLWIDSYEDTGEDVMLTHYDPRDTSYGSALLFKEPGTYTVKIELKVGTTPSLLFDDSVTTVEGGDFPYGRRGVEIDLDAKNLIVGQKYFFTIGGYEYHSVAEQNEFGIFLVDGWFQFEEGVSPRGALFVPNGSEKVYYLTRTAHTSHIKLERVTV